MSAVSAKPEVSAKNRPVIYKSMNVAEILGLLPDSAPLLAQYGLSCFNCSANTTETLEDGCRTHGFSDEDLQDLITDLNEMLASTPERPQTLTLTKDAALQLKEILDAENKPGWGLQVGLDANGGFAMEFVAGAESDEKTFGCAEVPTVSLFASSITLFSIGGASIDFRDGRFKLDLPEDLIKKQNCCQGKDACECGGGECGCA
jgi:hybrid cluster-associated redox disulfide protein